MTAHDRSCPHVMARMWHASDGQHLSGQRCRTFWMQTSGTALLAAERCSLVRVWMAAQDSYLPGGIFQARCVWHRAMGRKLIDKGWELLS